jgi:hypothetical protein
MRRQAAARMGLVCTEQLSGFLIGWQLLLSSFLCFLLAGSFFSRISVFLIGWQLLLVDFNLHSANKTSGGLP